VEAGGWYYQVTKKVVLGGEGSWDYLICDSAARRVYISRGTHVMVVDADSYAVVGDIPGTDGVHGIALAPDFGRGFTSNGRANTVTIFDLKTLKVLGTAPTDDGPDAIIYDPASKRVFTFNGHGGNATAIDAASGTPAGTIALGGKPEFAVADGRGHVYNNLEDKSELLQIDSQKLTVTARWSLAPCEEPTGLSMDIQSRRLFAGCHNQMMVVVDADSGKVLGTPAIGQGVDATAFDRRSGEGGIAFSSNADGTLTYIYEDVHDGATRIEPLRSAATQRGARTMALDRKTHNIFFVTAEFGPPPAPTPDHPHPRPQAIPGTFTLLVVGDTGWPLHAGTP
jgi:DNA-binding beta-propeller fold protein YncE